MSWELRQIYGAEESGRSGEARGGIACPDAHDDCIKTAVFRAFAGPEHLARWWSRSTIHSFDFRPADVASAIIYSSAFPQYPIRGVEQNIRFHLRQSPTLRDYLTEAFDGFPTAGLALLSLKGNNKGAETAADLQRLIKSAGAATHQR
jgi:hypothetical protein